MASFIGRQEELTVLDYVYESSIKNCYINARPRYGATTLVRRFCEKSKTIYTTFHECTPLEAVRSFKEAIENFTGEPINITNPTFADLFHILSKIAREFDPIVVFDGTHHAPEDFPSQLKWFSDNENVMIILIGDNDSHRYDFTITETIELRELTRKECGPIHPKMSDLESLKTYMAVGGVPLYNSLLNKSDFASSVEKTFLGNYPRLCMECENILRRSSVPYPICCAVLQRISSGTGRPVEIAEEEGISRQLCDIYLKKLTEERIIRTLVPIGNSPRKPVYIMDNPLLAFYFMVVRRNPHILFDGEDEYNSIGTYADMFMELRFRDICEEYLREHYDCITVGRWWLKEEDTNKPTLAAIVRIDGAEQTLVADCKFRKGKIDTGAMKAFSNRAGMIAEVPEKKLIMFSISGFEDKVIKRARSEGIILVGPNDLL